MGGCPNNINVRGKTRTFVSHGSTRRFLFETIFDSELASSSSAALPLSRPLESSFDKPWDPWTHLWTLCLCQPSANAITSANHRGLCMRHPARPGGGGGRASSAPLASTPLHMPPSRLSLDHKLWRVVSTTNDVGCQMAHGWRIKLQAPLSHSHCHDHTHKQVDGACGCAVRCCGLRCRALLFL